MFTRWYSICGVRYVLIDWANRKITVKSNEDASIGDVTESFDFGEKIGGDEDRHEF